MANVNLFMINKNNIFDMIPNTILLLIFENLPVIDFLGVITITCKRFNPIKKYFSTLSLSERCMNYIPQILNRIENNCIKRININNIVKMRDLHVQQLAHLQHIETFIAKTHIDDEAGITGNGLKIIGNNFKCLKHLSLYCVFTNSYDINDDNCWLDLLNLELLESLDLTDCGVNNNLFKCMRMRMINLQELCLKGCCDISDQNWMDIAKLQNIEKLNIKYCPIKNEQFVHITNNMRKLVSFNIAYCDRNK